MENPWKKLPLEIYESHMSFADVQQMQMLNHIMKKQFALKPDAVSVAVLGVAGGNGLEHCGEALQQIYGIDLNETYLEECKRRFRPWFGQRLKLIQADIADPATELPKVDLLIANLVIEYVGVEVFCQKVVDAQTPYVSCVIQQSAASSQTFVSRSPYQEQLRAVGAFHKDVDEDVLAEEFFVYGYGQSLREIYDLPKGKRFIRLDYKKAG